MDEALLKSSQWPNVAIPAGTDAQEAMAAHGVGSRQDDGRDVDTREKLEKDVREWLASKIASVMLREPYERMFIEWLDRQAAITERECREIYMQVSAKKQNRSSEKANVAEDVSFDGAKVTSVKVVDGIDLSSSVLWEDWTEFYNANECKKLHETDVAQFVFDLLDRQAAITRRETRQSWQDAPNILDRTNLKAIADLQAKVDELTAERDRLREALDDWQAGTFYAKLCEARAERDRLRGELATCQDVNERQDIEYVELKRERDRLQRVVRAQADSFGKLEREIADLRRDAARRGQLQPEAQNSALDGLRTPDTNDLRTAAYRHEHLIRAMWRDMDISYLTENPFTLNQVDGWKKVLEEEGIEVE